MAIPKFDELFNPLLQAMHELGGSASVAETEEKVAEILNFSDKEINDIHRGSTTKLSYRLAWARNYLKRFGLLENSSRGVWSLTEKGNSTNQIDKENVKKAVKDFSVKLPTSVRKLEKGLGDENEWQNELLGIIKKLTPQEFEKLCQRILREAGFIQVKITGKSGDRGVDGIGLIKIAGFLSFRVIFQCKRYQGSISSQQVREFKGTMVGRADKGLFLTTGRFTREAKEEATRDGSAPIDLVDGKELAEKMKELGLGVKISTEELIEVIPDWFKSF